MKYLIYVSFIGALASLLSIYFIVDLTAKVITIQAKCVSDKQYYK